MYFLPYRQPKPSQFKLFTLHTVLKQYFTNLFPVGFDKRRRDVRRRVARRLEFSTDVV